MPSHDTLAAEAAAFLEVLAGRLQRYAEPAADASHNEQRCTGCPVCVALTYLDEHRDVGVQIAHGVLTVVTALRQHMPPAGGGAAGARPDADASAGDEAAADRVGGVTAGAAVQRIDIR